MMVMVVVAKVIQMPMVVALMTNSMATGLELLMLLVLVLVPLGMVMMMRTRVRSLWGR